jgi:hypothetical protein
MRDGIVSPTLEVRPVALLWSGAVRCEANSSRPRGWAATISVFACDSSAHRSAFSLWMPGNMGPSGSRSWEDRPEPRRLL